MINFFRRIRKQLADDNKPLKYLRYAIGEIALVVIGILIAIQINTWNQQRISAAEQKLALLNLNQEFLQNKKLLDTSISNISNALETNIFLLSLMGGDRQLLGNTNIDSILSTAFIADEFRPSVNAIEDIIQSGRLNLLNNNKLSILLSQWTNINTIYEDRDDTLDDWTYNQTIPYLSKFISFIQVDLYGDNEWAAKSKLKTDYYTLFQELEFENIIENQLFFTNECLNRLQEGNAILEQLIQETNTNH